MSTTPHLIAVDHPGLRLCPQCGAWQWLQGLTYYQCAPCGYRDGPTPVDTEMVQPPKRFYGRRAKGRTMDPQEGKEKTERTRTLSRRTNYHMRRGKARQQVRWGDCDVNSKNTRDHPDGFPGSR